MSSKARIDRRGARRGDFGNRRFEPTALERQQVQAYAAVGLTRDQMADLLRISKCTLDRHFPEELAGGKALANGKVAARLFQKAMAGDTVSMLFWLKTQAGWVEPRAPIYPVMPEEPQTPATAAERSLLIEFVDPPALPAPKHPANGKAE